MHQNVGATERVIRLAIGAAAGAAALAVPRGWQRSALCGMSTAGFLTGLTRYCPLNAALGIDRATGARMMTEHDFGVRDTEIRRQTQTSAAMGQSPSSVQEASPVGAS